MVYEQDVSHRPSPSRGQRPAGILNRTSTGEIHDRARRAVGMLLGRELVLQLFAISAGIALARMLGPTAYGVFGIALFVITVAGLVADLGMRAALIRQQAEVTERQLATCFTVQLGLTLAAVATLEIGAPYLAAAYPLVPSELAWVIRVAALDLLVRAWRAMSEVRLERALRYRALALTDVAGSTAFHAVALVLVAAGGGAVSLAWATIAGNVLRTALLYRAAPWPVRIHIDTAAARAIAGVGVSLQTSRVVSLAPGWVTPTLLGGMLGPEAVGLITWASTLGHKPLELLESVVRVSMPHFARLQDDLSEVERTLARYAVGAVLACGLWCAVFVVAGRDLVALVYTERWLPAVPALLVYAASGPVASVRWLASNALLGIGRIGFTVTVNAVMAVVSIGASTLLLAHLGGIGVPLGQLVGLALGTPWLLSGLRAGHVGRMLRHTRVVILPLTAAIAVGAVPVLWIGTGLVRGPVAAAVAAVAFTAVAWYSGPAWLRESIRRIRTGAGPTADLQWAPSTDS